MSARIVALGCAVPAGLLTQEAAAMEAARLVPRQDRESARVRVLYRRAGVRTRGSVLIEDANASSLPSAHPAPPAPSASHRATEIGSAISVPSTHSDSCNLNPTPARHVSAHSQAPLEQGFFGVAQHARDRGPGTGERVDRYQRLAPVLAQRACAAALARVPTTRQSVAQLTSSARHKHAESDTHDVRRSITHLVTVSCTGVGSPGVDAALVQSLGLRPSVERLNVAFMGCHGTVNGLRAARALALADPAARVLMCAVELCSLHFHYTSEPDQVVANALFGDGAAACIVDGPPVEPGQKHTPEPPAGDITILGGATRLIEGSASAMGWRVGDHGFEMTLSPRVPALIRAEVAGFVDDMLARLSLARRDVRAWAVHPGGPRVLSEVEAALGLDPHALAVSRRVLSEHGNMSSATLLFILNRMARGARASGIDGRRLAHGTPAASRADEPPVRDHETAVRGPVVALAFGPGLVMEGLVLEFA